MQETASQWNRIYQTKGIDELGWFQAQAKTSLDLTQRFAPDRQTPVLDMGGGASVYLSNLRSQGYVDLTLLDQSPAALAKAQARWGRHGGLRYRCTDLFHFTPARQYGLWHDRACFHFLWRPHHLAQYRTQLTELLKAGGIALIAGFGPRGPQRCSGLSVRRLSAEQTALDLGEGFRLLAQKEEPHFTPGGFRQNYLYLVFQKE